MPKVFAIHRYDARMVRTSYLRVYQPITRFSREERERWAAASGSSREAFPRSWLITQRLPDEQMEEEVFVRKVQGDTLICPRRTRLRVLASLLAFRDSVPDEVADEFVPEGVARRAARELARIGETMPEVRSHILQANWHVPLRWFVAFDDSERVLIEDRHGLRIRYETKLSTARERLKTALRVLDGVWSDDEIASSLEELAEWIALFPSDGLLEMDYASVAGLFPPDELVEDRTAAEIAACLDSVARGDLRRAASLYSSVTDRWADVRAQEILN